MWERRIARSTLVGEGAIGGPWTLKQVMDEYVATRLVQHTFFIGVDRLPSVSLLALSIPLVTHARRVR